MTSFRSFGWNTIGQLHSLLVTLVAGLLICGSATETHAKGIPIVWGWGENMIELGELPSQVAAEADKQAGEHVTVAFLHERVHIFWLNLWTWNGKHVLHSNDKYWELEPRDWQELIGKQPTEEYGTPFLYRFPLVPCIVVLLSVGVFVRQRFFKTAEEKLTDLAKDERYQQALQIIFDADQDEDKFVTTIDEQKFTRAKDHLISRAIPAEAADFNLRELSLRVVEATNERIDSYLEYASSLEHAGEWDQSAEVYSDVIARLPASHPRIEYARTCLAEVNVKRKRTDSE